MADHQQSQEVLHGILHVLQSIEKKLEGYGDRLRSLEGLRDMSGDEYNEEKGVDSGADEDHKPPQTGRFFARHSPDSRGGTIKPKIFYSDWAANHLIESWHPPLPTMFDDTRTHLDEFFDFRVSQAIEQKLGDCWKMPDDDRLPLKFFKVNILKSNIPWGTSGDTIFKAKQPYERELDFLYRFDQDLRSYKGNDFVVVDFDSYNNSRIYRLGESAIGPDLLVEVRDGQEAPWTRIV